jgi:ribosomal protein L32
MTTGLHVGHVATFASNGTVILGAQTLGIAHTTKDGESTVKDKSRTSRRSRRVEGAVIAALSQCQNCGSWSEADYGCPDCGHPKHP